MKCRKCNKELTEKHLVREEVDMAFTDPPYGVSYEAKTKNIVNQRKVPLKIENDDIPLSELKVVISKAFDGIDSVLADKSCYYICSPQGGSGMLMMMTMMQESRIPCRHMIVWVKNAPVFSMGRLDYDYRHEPILFGWSKNRVHRKSTGAGSMKSSVWEVAREQNRVHPTMKPIALMENAIINSCPTKGSVYDPFLGSGSTLIACEKTKRKCYGMEIDPHYVDVIVKRWEEYSGKKAESI